MCILLLPFSFFLSLCGGRLAANTFCTPVFFLSLLFLWVAQQVGSLDSMDRPPFYINTSIISMFVSSIYLVSWVFFEEAHVCVFTHFDVLSLPSCWCWCWCCRLVFVGVLLSVFLSFLREARCANCVAGSRRADHAIAVVYFGVCVWCGVCV